MAAATAAHQAVPGIIHQTAPEDRRRWDPRWERCQASWRAICPEPEYQYHFWNDEHLRDLVAAAFPQHLCTYDAYEEHIQRVDFARAAMLHVHGGLYVDMDVEALRNPFGHLREGLVTVIGSPYVKNEKHQNAMMASPPGHPFWTALAEEAARRQREPGRYNTTWQLTGPQLLDAVVEMRPEDVHVLPYPLFNPSAQSVAFNAPEVFTRHFCTSVWTHDMDTIGMRLHQAARCGDRDGASAAARAGANIECRDYAGRTPAHHAALRGDVGMLACLLELQACVDVLDKNDTTPLHYAVQIASVGAVQLLLDRRADLRGRLREGALAGATPLDLAVVGARQKCDSRPALDILGLLEQHARVGGAAGSLAVATTAAAAVAAAAAAASRGCVSGCSGGLGGTGGVGGKRPWWASVASRPPSTGPLNAAAPLVGSSLASPAKGSAACCASVVSRGAKRDHFSCSLSCRPGNRWAERRRTAFAFVD
mmetsp:Transcript_102604/g.330969  ORF Transcript_102604/g.330969 Transcript_102604/m.330969 type:complete len:480 (-) Transcript_102604:31-1470(-)